MEELNLVVVCTRENDKFSPVLPDYCFNIEIQ